MTYYSSAAACPACPGCQGDSGGDDGDGDGESGGCYINNIKNNANLRTVTFDQFRNYCFVQFSVDNVCHGGEIELTPSSDGSSCGRSVSLNDCSDTVGYQVIDPQPFTGNNAICHVIEYIQRSGSATVPFKLCRRVGSDITQLSCAGANHSFPNGDPRPINAYIFRTTPWRANDAGFDSCLQSGIARQFNNQTVIYPPYVSGEMSNQNGAFGDCCDSLFGQNQGGYNGVGSEEPWCTQATLEFEFDRFLGPYYGPNGPLDFQQDTYEPLYEDYGPNTVWRKRVKAHFECKMLFAPNIQPDPFDAGANDDIPQQRGIEHDVTILFVGRCEPNNEEGIATNWIFEPVAAWVSRPANGDRFTVTSDGYEWKGPTLEAAGVTAEPFTVAIDWPVNTDLVL